MFNLQIIPVSPFQQNCSIIWDDNKNAAIIDAGDNAEKIIEFVESQGLNVEKLLLTHGHLDHIMAVEKVRDHFGVEVYGSHKADQPLFEQLPQMCGFFDFENKIAFSGDVLFKDSIGRTDLYMGNLDQLLETIHTKMFDLDDDFIIIAGHGSHTTIGREKIHNPFLK